MQIAVHCAAAHARALRMYGKVDILGGGMIAAAAHSVQHQAALIGVAAAFHGSPLLSLPFRTLCVGRGDMERITETTEEISGICNMVRRFAEGKIWRKKVTKLLKILLLQSMKSFYIIKNYGYESGFAMRFYSKQKILEKFLKNREKKRKTAV